MIAPYTAVGLIPSFWGIRRRDDIQKNLDHLEDLTKAAFWLANRYYDKPCTVNKEDPSKASCACTLVKDQGDYVIVTDSYNQSTCTTDVWSSATVQQITQVTDFLKSKDQLKPFPIKVLNAPAQK